MENISIINFCLVLLVLIMAGVIFNLIKSEYMYKINGDFFITTTDKTNRYRKRVRGMIVDCSDINSRIDRLKLKISGAGGDLSCLSDLDKVELYRILSDVKIINTYRIPAKPIKISEEVIQCPTCGCKYKSKNSKHKHLDVFNNCQVCGQVFSLKG